MAVEISGSLDAQGLRLGIIVAQFNEALTSRLLRGAREAAARHGVKEDALTVVHVPGEDDPDLDDLLTEDRYEF